MTFTGKCFPISRKKLKVTKLAHPVVVIQQQSTLITAVEIKEPSQLLLHAGNVLSQNIFGEQFPLFALCRSGSPIIPGRPTNQRDRTMAGLLETSQDHQRHQVPNVQAIGSRVKAGINGSRLLGEQFRQIFFVGRLVD